MQFLLHVLVIAFFATLSLGCNGQNTGAQTNNISSNKKQKPVGGGCDGCELMFAGMPPTINDADTSAGWNEPGEKFFVKGIAYKPDGKTPAPNVVIYYYHTDNNGYYSPGVGMNEKARRHGHLRGWVQTSSKGMYSIFTIRPAPYPNSSNPSHIHLIVKEEGMNEYYIDELVFDDDKLLTADQRKRLERRGGSGILKVRRVNDLQVAEHKIVLGLNIPGYPK